MLVKSDDNELILDSLSELIGCILLPRNAPPCYLSHSHSHTRTHFRFMLDNMTAKPHFSLPPSATNWFVLIFMTCICFTELKTLDCLLPSFSLVVCLLVCVWCLKCQGKDGSSFCIYSPPPPHLTHTHTLFLICLSVFRAAHWALIGRRSELGQSSGASSEIEDSAIINQRLNSIRFD